MISYLQVDGLTKSFGDRVLFRNITFGIAQGQKTGLIAGNGVGKTTLLNILAAKENYDEGAVVFRNDLRVGYLEQIPYCPEDLTVLEACFYSSHPAVRLIAEYEAAMAAENPLIPEDLMMRMEHAKAWDYERKARQILSRLNIDRLDRKTGQLSGGQLKRVALANVLIAEPELLLLDEPTNHLDLEMIEWLEEYLGRSHISLLMVTHDRYFLDRVCNDILEMDNREMYPYKGNYSYYLEKRSERVSARNVEIERTNNLLRKELDWMRRQPQARGTKAKYRIDAFCELEEKAKQKQDTGTIRLNIRPAYIGSRIFEAVNVSKRYGDTWILRDFNYTFARYEKLGIIGDNGTGKSTFIKMLVGEVSPDSGRFDIGETVRFGYYSQEGLLPDENRKVIDLVQDIAEYITPGDGKTLGVAQFLNYFLFAPDRQHQYVHKLSGGEKRRLYLCTVLMRNPNFLVLDEPTNDLDIVTLNVLEEYLQSFKGCLMVVSHDRYFMDKIVDHLFIFHGNAEIQDFPGSYTQYRAWTEEQPKAQKETLPEPKKMPAGRSAKEPKRKRTWQEQREFESLEPAINTLEEEKAQLETILSSGTLPHDELTRQARRIAEIIDAIDQKTNRWLELSNNDE
ncbi:MAG: ABC-F family ATP-binding cassette domain-containing protein [Tannerella sp.]|jgi:ATP-binding cassette subfamily F protein uup|nr:ABC-F family ATP-binding cassette domain-containing protein [Tannerella sp.]